MPSILKIRREWSLLHFKIRRDRSPHKILKIWRDWSLPFREIGVPQNNQMLSIAVSSFQVAVPVAAKVSFFSTGVLQSSPHKGLTVGTGIY